MNQSETAARNNPQLRRVATDLFVLFKDTLDSADIDDWVREHLPRSEPVAGSCGDIGAGGEDVGVERSTPLSARWPQARWLRMPDPSVVEAALAGDLVNQTEIERMSPVYVRCEEMDGADVGLIATGDVLALRSPDVSIETIREALRPLDDRIELLDAPWADGPAEPLMLFRVHGAQPEEAFEVVRGLEEMVLEGRDGRSVELFEFVEADLIQLHDAFCNIAQKLCSADTWHLKRIQHAQALALLPSPLPDVLVGVIDSGCDLDNPLLNNRLARDAQQRPITLGFEGAATADHNGHGTMTCGVIAADPEAWDAAPYPVSIRGVAPNAILLPARLSGRFRTQDVVDALTWCERQGAQVINMSVTWSGLNLSVDWVLASALISDVLVIASAGNAGQRRWPRHVVAYPSRHPAVLAVGASGLAMQPNETRIDYSQHGPLIDVVAPGEAIATAKRQSTTGGPYETSPCTDGYAGTSAAAPVVSGLAALLRGAYPHLSAWEVRGVIEAGCEKIGAAVGERYFNLPWRPKGPWSYRTGYGRINAERSVTLSDVSISRIAPRQQPDGQLVPQQIIAGAEHFLYIAVHNAGPSTATNVKVSLRAVLGLADEPRYPEDWTTVDASHVALAPQAQTIPSILAGDTRVLEFTIVSGLAVLLEKHAKNGGAVLVAEAECATDHPHVATEARSVHDSNNLAIHRLNEENPVSNDFSHITRSPSWRNLLIFAIGGLVGVLLILALLGGMLLLARNLAPANVCCHGGPAIVELSVKDIDRNFPRPFPNPVPNKIIGQVGSGFTGTSCKPVSTSSLKNGLTVELEEQDPASDVWNNVASTTTANKSHSQGSVDGYYEFGLSGYTGTNFRVVVPSGSFSCDSDGSADGVVEFAHSSGGAPALADFGLK